MTKIKQLKSTSMPHHHRSDLLMNTFNSSPISSNAAALKVYPMSSLANSAAKKLNLNDQHSIRLDNEPKPIFKVTNVDTIDTSFCYISKVC